LELDIKNDSDLLNLLSTAAPEDLDALVEVLTDSGAGRLALSARSKQALLVAKRLHRYDQDVIKLMISELQCFGGNSLVNNIRGSGVEYREIVVDAAKKLGILLFGAFNENLESEILALFNENWKKMSEEKRKQYKNDIRRFIVVVDWSKWKKLSPPSMIKSIINLVPILPHRIAYSALGIAYSAMGITYSALVIADPALKITIPCVALIAIIRQKQIVSVNDIKRPPPSYPDAESSNRLVPILDEGMSPQFFIGHLPNKPLVTINTLPTTTGLEGTERVDIESTHIDRLSPLLQIVPNVLVTHEVGANRYLRVVVNGQLAAAADGDGLRGFVRDAEGKFQEHARFYEDDRLKNLVNGAALFQLASVVVAQKHLADISAKLSEIRESVQEILSFLNEARRAKITGRIDYLRRNAKIILSGNADSAVRHTLEQIEVELNEVQKHIESEIDELVKNVKNEKDPDTFGTTGLTETLLKRQEKINSLLEQWRLCMGARMVACRLNGTFREAVEGAVELHGELKTTLENFLSDAGPVHRFKDAIKGRIDSLSSRTDSENTIFANRILLSNWEKYELPAFEQASTATFDRIEQQLLEQQQPVVLTIRMEGGHVKEAYRVLA
jgi:hypothetical protein